MHSNLLYQVSAWCFVPIPTASINLLKPGSIDTHCPSKTPGAYRTII